MYSLLAPCASLDLSKDSLGKTVTWIRRRRGGGSRICRGKTKYFGVQNPPKS